MSFFCDFSIVVTHQTLRRLIYFPSERKSMNYPNSRFGLDLIFPPCLSPFPFSFLFSDVQSLKRADGKWKLPCSRWRKRCPDRKFARKKKFTEWKWIRVFTQRGKKKQCLNLIMHHDTRKLGNSTASVKWQSSKQHINSHKTMSKKKERKWKCAESASDGTTWIRN